MEEVVKEVIVTDDTPEEVVTPEVAPKPGEKTDPAKLLESLQKAREEKNTERDARIAAENELATLKAAQNTDVLSPEGKALQEQLDALKTQLSAREKAEMRSSLETKFPALKDKAADFEQYLSDNPGMKLETAAKSFMIENDLLDAKPRKGLEPAGGGTRTAPKSGKMTVEELEDLRINNYRKYSDMLRNGEIKFD